jgi:hypothetical protein
MTDASRGGEAPGGPAPPGASPPTEPPPGAPPPTEPPPLPDVDADGWRLVTALGAQRRALARRAVGRPAGFLAAALFAVALFAWWRPLRDIVVPPLLDDVRAALPLGLDRLDLLALLTLPFAVMAAVALALGVAHARRTAAARLRVGGGGRLIQADGAEEHVDLEHLLDVDVAPNRAFTDLNERIPVGSVLVLRLTDATGARVDVNPGMWAEEDTLIAIIRRYVWDGHAAVSPEAAERYGLPVRGRHGEAAHPGEGPALRGEPPHSDEEREARLRALGIEVQRGEPGADDAAGRG